jgi:hypothetical protein
VTPWLVWDVAVTVVVALGARMAQKRQWHPSPPPPAARYLILAAVLVGTVTGPADVMKGMPL